MEILSHPLIVAFILTWALEFHLFGMQRASLIISRSNNVDYNIIGRQLLPSWYPLTWIVTIAKYGLLVAIFIIINWKPAIILLVIGFILSSTLPIPYRFLYKKIFRNRVRNIINEDPEKGYLLADMLDNVGF